MTCAPDCEGAPCAVAPAPPSAVRSRSRLPLTHHLALKAHQHLKAQHHTLPEVYAAAAAPG
eukprot:366222-Chlamydomonas_euryale.AAC.14